MRGYGTRRLGKAKMVVVVVVIAAPVSKASATMQGAQRHCFDKRMEGIVVTRWAGRMLQSKTRVIDRRVVG